MLKSSSNADVAVCIAVHEQDLDLTCRAIEDLRCCRVADCFVAGDDAIIVSRFRYIFID